MKIYIDGAYYSKSEAKISVFDHGLLYGDGVFEGLRIYQGAVFRLEDHIKRLYDSAKAIMLEIPMTPNEMVKTVLEAVSENKKENGYIRLVITRGVGNLGLNPVSCEKPSVIIIVDDISLYPESTYIEGIRIVSTSTRRAPSDVLDPRIKSLNYLNNIMAKIEALQSGCLEAVMLNKEGFVAECTADNIFYIKQGKLFTPDPASGALEGITRKEVLVSAGAIGILTVEKRVTQYDLYTADECFLTGTAAEIIPVVSVDGRIIGDGKPGEFSMDIKAALYKRIFPD